MKSTISLVALVLAGALPIGALAADPPKSPAATEPAPMPAQPAPDAGKAAPPEAGKTEMPPMFKELDLNKDGQVSKDEAKRSADVLARFETLDSDHNGKVSLVEWNTSEKPKAGAKP